MDLNSIADRLKKHGQEHLLMKYDQMNEEQKQKLLTQILNIDFELMKSLYENAISEVDHGDIEIEPVDYIDKSKLTESEKEQYIEKGIAVIKDKELAVLTMAGGQGTRLGHQGPKGTYKIEMEKDKSLFELLCDHLKFAVEKYNTFINWYIMTSEENYERTVAFFEEENYFDYPKNYVKFFKQGQLPMIGEDGKILLDKEGFVKEAADGHGGTLETLKKTGILSEMEEKGFKWIFISGVDNVLANLVDPLLIGLAVTNKSEIALKSVEKTDPEEKAGVFCKKNKKVGVIEYTEITKDMANMRDNYGSLVYGDLNALLHLFSIEKLKDICEKRLPYHTAHKKADYLDEDGKLVIAKKPNAYKFESFIFDSFEMSEKVDVIRVKREEEFAPLKNKEGVDSPETAKKLYGDYLVRKTAYENYEKWLNDRHIDDETKRELQKISGNEVEIKERFYGDLEFGTAGLRGIMGAGTNRMNRYTVLKATQGLANYIVANDLEERGVAILYDTRNNSKEFALETALCLNANGIRTYMFDEPRPIPILSYSVPKLGAAAGIMITASHNPPEYNGYKVFWEDGAQIVEPIDKGIIEEIRKIKRFSEIKMVDLEKAKKSKLYNEVGNALETAYIRDIKKLSIYDKEIAEEKKNLKVVYSPLHGTGGKVVNRVLESLGYENIYTVPEQELGNGNFPTVDFPNPEHISTFEYSVRLAEKIDADLCIATDPDSDRIGVMVKNIVGMYEPLQGNEIGKFLLEYVLSTQSEKGILYDKSAVVSTVVSTRITKEMAKTYNVNYYEGLTGFKNIARHIRSFEEKYKNGETDKKEKFLFGFEESFGYLYGNNARDKDGVISTMLFLEAAAYYKNKGITVLEQMEKIDEKYGYYREHTITITLKGIEGQKQIEQIMETLRENKAENINGMNILRIRDYLNGTLKDMKTGKIENVELPKTNLLYFEIENDVWVAARPSGTEPKIKFYMGVKAESLEKTTQMIKIFIDSVGQFIDVKSEENKKLFLKRK